MSPQFAWGCHGAASRVICSTSRSSPGPRQQDSSLHMPFREPASRRRAILEAGPLCSRRVTPSRKPAIRDDRAVRGYGDFNRAPIGVETGKEEGVAAPLDPVRGQDSARRRDLRRASRTDAGGGQALLRRRRRTRLGQLLDAGGDVQGRCGCWRRGSQGGAAPLEIRRRRRAREAPSVRSLPALEVDGGFLLQWR